MEKNKIAVLGLGYVGLPLAVEFSKHFKTIGFDVNLEKVEVFNPGDTRNTRVYDVYEELIKFGVLVSVYDPITDAGKMEKEFGITPVQNWNEQPFDFYVEKVAHSLFDPLKVKVSPDRLMCLF